MIFCLFLDILGFVAGVLVVAVPFQICRCSWRSIRAWGQKKRLARLHISRSVKHNTTKHGEKGVQPYSACEKGKLWEEALNLQDDDE